MRTIFLGLLLASLLQAGQDLQVMEVRQPEPPSWGTNTAMLTIRNQGARPREVIVSWQSTSLVLGRGWGMDTTESIAAGATRTLSQDFVIPAFPGKVAHRLCVRDGESQAVLWERRNECEFPFANARANPLRIPVKLRTGIGLAKSEYPRLAMVQRGPLVLYYLEGDRYIESRVEEIAAERERIYRELAGKINPAFDSPIALYPFPDADSKFAYTNHRGAGMANGRVLAEIFTEKERIDPYHEVTHIIAGSIGEPPALFNEGMAAWFQRGHRWDGYPADAWAKAFAAQHLLWPVATIFSFTEFGSEASRGAIAYPEGASLVNYLVGRYGFEKFLTAYRALRSSSDRTVVAANNAEFQKIFGVSLAEVERAWLATLAAAPSDPALAAKVAAIASRLDIK